MMFAEIKYVIPGLKADPSVKRFLSSSQKLMSAPFTSSTSLVIPGIHFTFITKKAIANAGAATFEILGYRYARDSRQVYFHVRAPAGAQVAFFKVIGPCYALDDQHVYLGGDVI
jgi:hypothetical protein